MWTLFWDDDDYEMAILGWFLVFSMVALTLPRTWQVCWIGISSFLELAMLIRAAFWLCLVDWIGMVGWILWEGVFCWCLPSVRGFEKREVI